MAKTFRLMMTLIAVFLFSAESFAAGGLLQAGVAVVDITPYPGCRMSGYFSERLNTGMLDPLLAKAVVFQQGETSAALVFCDVAGISLKVSQQAREIVSRETGIPNEHIAIAATHSHTGPLYFGALRKHYHDKALDEKGRDKAEIVDFSIELTGRLVRVIQKAKQNLQPVRLNAGYAREERLSFNRRFHLRNGTVRFNPGQLNPNIVRAAGPIDPEVGLVQLTNSTSGTPIAALISFALHLDTVGGTKFSADFPRYLQDHLKQSHGENFVSLFGAGTCGDINHVDVTIRGRRKTEQIGGMLAETVEKQLPQLPAVGEPSLAVRSASIEAKLQSYTAEQIDEAKRNMEQVNSPKLPFLKRVEAYKITALQLRGGATIRLEVQAFRLSRDVAIVTLPGEVFVELGMAIKQASPFPTTLVIELTNDTPGYIPTKKAFAEGSYETVNSRVVPGSGEKMVETAIRLLNELGQDS